MPVETLHVRLTHEQRQELEAVLETTPATTQDVERLGPVHAALAAMGLLPGEHLGD
jgi:hypothetical protein